MAAIAASAAAACANAAAQRGRWRPLAQRRRRRSRHHSAHPLPLPLHHVVVVLLLLLAATVSNLVVNAALEVRPPAAFVQCQPATVAISAKGNVTVSVRLGHGDTHNVTHLGVAPKEWRWSPVDLPAGTNFTLVVRDERPRNATTTNSDKKTMLLGTFSTSEVVQLPAGTPNITDCFNTSRTNTTSSPTSGTNTRGKDASSSKGSGGSSSSKRRRITQVAVVSALLGGLLFLLLILVGTVVVRRRAEAKQLEAARAARGSQYGKGDNGSERRPSSEFGAVAAGRGMPHDAGWKYMANLVGEDLSPNPSLARSQYPPASSRRGSGSLHSSFDATFSPSQQAAVVRGSPRRAGGGAAPFKTNRYDNDTVDVDLPSYGHSQYDARIAGGEGRVRGADTAAAAPMSPAQLPQRYQHSGAETAVGYELRDDPVSAYSGEEAPSLPVLALPPTTHPLHYEDDDEAGRVTGDGGPSNPTTAAARRFGPDRFAPDRFGPPGGGGSGGDAVAAVTTSSSPSPFVPASAATGPHRRNTSASQQQQQQQQQPVGAGRYGPMAGGTGTQSGGPSSYYPEGLQARAPIGGRADTVLQLSYLDESR